VHTDQRFNFSGYAVTSKRLFPKLFHHLHPAGRLCVRVSAFAWIGLLSGNSGQKSADGPTETLHHGTGNNNT
jgi:hypothetical protein